MKLITGVIRPLVIKSFNQFANYTNCNYQSIFDTTTFEMARLCSMLNLVIRTGKKSSYLFFFY